MASDDEADVARTGRETGAKLYCINLFDTAMHGPSVKKSFSVTITLRELGHEQDSDVLRAQNSHI